MTTPTPISPEHLPRFTRSTLTNALGRPVFLLCAGFGVLLLGSLVAIMALGTLGLVEPAPTTAPGTWSIVLPNLVGTTLSTSVVALVFTVPIGLLGALYLSEFASPRARGWLEEPLGFLAQVPPIVYGYFSVATFLPALALLAPSLKEHPAVNAGIALAGMFVPVFLAQGHAALIAVPPQLRDGACALGAGKWAITWFVVLPAASTRLLAALVQAASRAVGETMIVLVVFSAYASRQTGRLDTLATFVIPNETTTMWGFAVSREWFVVACALLLLAFALDAARRRLEEPGQGEVR